MCPQHVRAVTLPSLHCGRLVAYAPDHCPAGGGETHDFELTIDEATDEPVVLSHDTAGCGPGDDAPGHAGPTGTCMSVDVAAVEKTTLPLLQQYFHGLQHTLSDMYLDTLPAFDS